MSVGVSVALADVSRRFYTAAGPVRAVDGISLQVAPATSLAITGPSGCGKSTLLSLVGALERPSEGRVAIGGRVVSAMTEPERAEVRRRLIGFVFQTDNLQPFLSAVENVSLQLALCGFDDHHGRSLELLGALGLEQAVDRFPDQLSGGERQRVAVARAVVHRPSLILADEPTGSLDHDNAITVIELLLQARAEVAATLVVITHDPDIAARLDRRITLRDGRVVADSAVVPGVEQRADV